MAGIDARRRAGEMRATTVPEEQQLLVSPAHDGQLTPGWNDLGDSLSDALDKRVVHRRLRPSRHRLVRDGRSALPIVDLDEPLGDEPPDGTRIKVSENVAPAQCGALIGRLRLIDHKPEQAGRLLEVRVRPNTSLPVWPMVTVDLDELTVDKKAVCRSHEVQVSGVASRN